VTKLGAEQPQNQAGERDFSLLHYIWTRCEANPTSYLNGY